MIPIQLVLHNSIDFILSSTFLKLKMNFYCARCDKKLALSEMTIVAFEKIIEILNERIIGSIGHEESINKISLWLFELSEVKC